MCVRVVVVVEVVVVVGSEQLRTAWLFIRCLQDLACFTRSEVSRPSLLNRKRMTCLASLFHLKIRDVSTRRGLFHLKIHDVSTNLQDVACFI